MKTSIIGLGIIGLEWAKHLHNDGHLSLSWNRSKKDEAPNYTRDLASLPAASEILHIVVADPSAVSEVLEVITPLLNSTHLIIQSSTIDPGSSAEFSARVQETGALYLEAPFTGSLPAAQKRELIFYAGGKHDTLNMARPYLETLAKSIFHIGSESQACTLKLVMNLQIASAFEALAEALSTARSAGISDDIFFEAFKLNASYSGVAALKEPKLRKNDFSPQFSIKHLAKDMRLLNKATAGTAMPVHLKILELLELAEQNGLGNEDFSALIKLR